MSEEKKNGDWKKLYKYLAARYPKTVTLTDDEIAEITGSRDMRQSPNSYFPIDDNPEWSIKIQAAKAGYSVAYKGGDKRTKIFTVP